MLTAERCLWCGGPLLNGCTIPEMMFADDSLCGLCRSQLTLISHQVKLGELSVRGLVLYDEAFMKMLVQYKECMDEALQDVCAHGQSWDNEVINKRQFEDGLRQNEQVTTQPDDTVKTVAIYRR